MPLIYYKKMLHNKRKMVINKSFPRSFWPDAVEKFYRESEPLKDLNHVNKLIANYHQKLLDKKKADLPIIRTYNPLFNIWRFTNYEFSATAINKKVLKIAINHLFVKNYHNYHDNKKFINFSRSLSKKKNIDLYSIKFISLYANIFKNIH